MKSERELEIDVQQAGEAARIIESPLTVAAIASMKAKIHQAIERSGAGDVEARQQAYYQLRAISMFEKEFFAIMQRGTKAQTLLQRLKSKLNP